MIQAYINDGIQHRFNQFLIFLHSKAKELINKIIVKGSGLPDGASMADGVVMEEVNIPGSKVGLVIGKGGENIKMLQV